VYDYQEILTDQTISRVEDMERLIRGEITEVSMEELKKLLPKRKLMIFVSSTFLDTNLERGILHSKILPDLQKKAQQHDIQVTIYDMRFGIKDENTLDHMTWETCKEAIQQCHEGSDGLFFLSLQADRYGYLPLPKYLYENTILKVKKDNGPNLNLPKIFDEWYIVDENHFPSRYELTALSSLNDSLFWQKVLPTLRDTVLHSAAFEDLKNISEELLIGHSVTEWETLFALNCDKERCYWVQRSFDYDALQAFSNNPNCSKLTDIFETNSPLPKLESLKAKMKRYLKEEQRVQLTPQMAPEDYFKEGSASQDYLHQWEQVLRGQLNNELDKVVGKLNCWNTMERWKIPMDHLQEIFHHCSMVVDKARTFYGRSVFN
jgi:hypothetical protein